MEVGKIAQRRQRPDLEKHSCTLEDKVRCTEQCLGANKTCLILRNLSVIKYGFLGPPQIAESKPLGIEVRNLYIFKVHRIMELIHIWNHGPVRHTNLYCLLLVEASPTLLVQILG